MIELLKNIVLIEADGKSAIVPVEEFDFVNKDIDLGEPGAGILPRIDVYTYDDCCMIHAWSIQEEQMFQIIEQIMHVFAPQKSIRYKLENMSKGKNGPLLETTFKVVSANTTSS